MSCPACDHAMTALGGSLFWCPRCGTLKSSSTEYGATDVPYLVGRCREYETRLDSEAIRPWITLGVAEAINVPGKRPRGA